MNVTATAHQLRGVVHDYIVSSPVAHTIIACIFISLGTVLSLLGRHIHKSFLLISGFLTGSILCSLVLYTINEETPLGSRYDLLLVTLAAILGLVGAGLFFLLWKISLIGIGVVAGIMISVSLNYISSLRHLLQKVPQIAVIGVVICIAVALIFIFEVFFVIVFSAVVGSAAIVIGIDMFVHTGLILETLQYIQHPSDGLFISDSMQTLLYVYGALISISILSQTILWRRRQETCLARKRRSSYERIDV